MNIIDLNKLEAVPFSSLNIGDVFYPFGTRGVYMKTERFKSVIGWEANSVDLETGKLMLTGEDASVYLVSAELRIRTMSVPEVQELLKVRAESGKKAGVTEC